MWSNVEGFKHLLMLITIFGLLPVRGLAQEFVWRDSLGEPDYIEARKTRGAEWVPFPIVAVAFKVLAHAVTDRVLPRGTNVWACVAMNQMESPLRSVYVRPSITTST